MDNKT